LDLFGKADTSYFIEGRTVEANPHVIKTFHKFTPSELRGTSVKIEHELMQANPKLEHEFKKTGKN
jgi:hypothetical protein